MKISFFNAHRYEREAFDLANSRFGHDIQYFEPRLTAQTASLAAGSRAVCSFVSDRVDRAALEELRSAGVELIALRCAGYNHVDLEAAAELGLPVVRVPEYSPYAVAEHAVALILSLDRKIYRAHARVREGNFALDGLVGSDLHGKTVGVVGTGKIGSVFARIMHGFGCRILAYDLYPSEKLQGELGAQYVSLDELYAESDVISLNVPLTPDTHHIINADSLSRMKRGVMLINTGRGALIDTKALIAALKSGHVGAAGLDVYEEEEGIFFADLSGEVLQDDVLARLMTFPNVLITAHQGFLTREALANIASVTLGNVTAFEQGKPLENEVSARQVLR
jgi:D-lactate dehydrogenase